jgi:cystathionine beta-lyase
LDYPLAAGLPDAKVCDLDGTYLVMVDLNGCLKGEDCQKIVQGRARLAVDYGEWFGDRYKGFIRMNLATDPAIVKEAVDRLVKALN